MLPLLTAQAAQEIDKFVVRDRLIPETLLMEHAALGLVGVLAARFGRALPMTRGLILAGHGNNGADAIAAARILANNGHPALSVIIDPSPTRSALNTLHLKMAEKAGVAILQKLSTELLLQADWILDGIFGVGFKGPIKEPYLEWIQAVQALRAQKYILSVDVPSGVNASTGQVPGPAVYADRTLCLGFYKSGLVTGQGAEHTGGLSLASIQIPREMAQNRTECFLIENTDAIKLLPRRKKDSHKGSFGKVQIIAAEKSMSGATVLCAWGSLTAGAGLTEVINPWNEDFARELPAEVIYKKGAVDPSAIIVVGPGLGQSKQAADFLKELIHSQNSLIIDADGLNLLAKKKTKRSAITILTPHPKEAARLLGKDVEAIQANRFQAAREIATEYEAIVLLKGLGAVISNGKKEWVVQAGDPGLAKGGSGDVLAGIIGALLGQGVEPSHAATLGAYLHGKASERLTQRFGHTYSHIATQVAEAVREVLGELS